MVFMCALFIPRMNGDKFILKYIHTINEKKLSRIYKFIWKLICLAVQKVNENWEDR